MGERRSALFRGRHFRDEIIVLCLRWYLRYPLSYRDLEEMMAERGLAIDHSTLARWVHRYAPVLNERIRSEMRNPNRSWRVDETYIRVAGRCSCVTSPSVTFRPCTYCRTVRSQIWLSGISARIRSQMRCAVCRCFRGALRSSCKMPSMNPATA